MSVVVHIENIEKSFGRKRVLEDFSLQVEEGEMVALCGASGCGKTTLLNIIGLLESFNSGVYFLFGNKNVRPNSSQALRMARSELSYLFQNFALVDNMTVEKNLAIALYYVKSSREAKLKMMEDALEAVGLKGFLKAKVAELSGGEQQRVSIARSIIKPGRLILADEPTGSLDSTNRDNAISLIQAVNRLGKTVILVTHDPEVASRCSRVVNIG
jgi:putative ABC transport system ATP-binding protein